MNQLIKILKEINPDLDYEKEDALIDDGLFDSLEVMAIVGEISTVFGLDIEPDDVTAENFNSAANMIKMINRYKKSSDPA